MVQLNKSHTIQFINSLKMKNSQQKNKLGCFVKMLPPNYLLSSLEEAISYNANCFMFYTGSPQSSYRVPIDKLKITEFKNALKNSKIDINDLAIHCPYIMNLANDDIMKQNSAKALLLNEIKRANAIGINFVVLHPGNNKNKLRGCEYIANAINEINKNNDNVVICLETMAGKGNEIGTNFVELRSIINLIHDKNKIGICFDTCHLNDSGVDVSNPNKILTDFDKIIGLNYLKLIHINDSLNIIGAKKDRHANIGKGTIGLENLKKWIHNPILISIPKILETPYVNNKSIYKEEIELLLSK